MKRYILPALLAFVGATVIVAVAQDLPNRNGNFVIRRIEHRLGVTPAQREQVKTILTTERPLIQQLKQQAEAERLEMDAPASFNEAQVRTVASKYAETNTQILVERAKVHSEIFAVLTPEQRIKLDALRADVSATVDARLETLGDQL